MDQNNELQLPIDLIETITDDKLRNNVTLDLSQRITAPVGDIKEIMDRTNNILSSNYRFNNATSFKDISSRLTKEKLNVESKAVTVAATSSAAPIEIKPDAEYVGLSSVVVNVKPLQDLIVPRITPENFNYIPDDSAELETIYLKSTSTTSTAIDITITTNNPTEYSGLNKVTINDIGIIQNQKFTVSKEHLISSNTFKVVFADDEHFGASDVDITVPLVKNKRFTVNKNTIGRTYVPAEGDLALDGTTITDTVPAIGFESVTLDASIASGVTASTLKSLSISGQGGAIMSPGGTALGYESVEIPTLETLEASTVKAALIDLDTTLYPNNFGYSKVQLPGAFDLQITAAGVSSAKEMGANYLFIRRTDSDTEPYIATGVIIPDENNINSTDKSILSSIGSSFVNVIGSSDNNMLRDVLVALPEGSNTETELVMFLVQTPSSGSIELNVSDENGVTSSALISSSLSYCIKQESGGSHDMFGTYYLYSITKNSSVDIILSGGYTYSTMELYIQQVKQETSTDSTNYTIIGGPCIGKTGSVTGAIKGSFKPISDTAVSGYFNNSPLDEYFGTFDLSKAKIYAVFGFTVY